MGLGIEEIRKLVREQKNRKTVNKAVFHQNRIRFHAQASVARVYTQAEADFFAFVSNLIPHDKFEVFKTLFRYPVKTNEVAEICFEKLSRIFEGRNPAFNYQFADSELRSDWEAYRQKELREPEVWSSKGWEYFKTEINSVLVVDLPAEQDKADRYPKPYFYWLPISNVLAYEADSGTGIMRWIAFRQEGGRIAVMDDWHYRLFAEGKDGSVGALLAEKPHGLGYCPARFFWGEAVSLQEPDVKASPLTRVLESLDWYLFYHISKRHLDLYGAYPIYSGYEQDCDFSNEENGDYCDGGYLKNKQGFYKFDPSGRMLRCPKCGDKRIAGVGSFVEIPVPDGDKQPDLRNPVQMLTVDRNSLDYNVAEEERLRTDIITAVVGTNEEVTTRDALNEQQVRANFESQSTVLNRVKKGFEAAQQFVDETVCRLRYGEGFLSASIDYGTEFFVFDVSELRERYRAAKENGASESELDALHNEIIASEYRNDPAQLRRMLVLEELEPFRHLNRKEVSELHGKQLVSDEELYVKLNFMDLVRRFERENTNVLDFGSQIPFDRKISIINKKLQDYARERKREN